eukprot:SAG11_NODE_38020_length_254_cov_0.670968_1_plen_23_part_10
MARHAGMQCYAYWVAHISKKKSD